LIEPLFPLPSSSARRVQVLCGVFSLGVTMRKKSGFSQNLIFKTTQPSAGLSRWSNLDSPTHVRVLVLGSFLWFERERGGAWAVLPQFRPVVRVLGAGPLPTWCSPCGGSIFELLKIWKQGRKGFCGMFFGGVILFLGKPFKDPPPNSFFLGPVPPGHKFWLVKSHSKHPSLKLTVSSS